MHLGLLRLLAGRLHLLGKVEIARLECSSPSVIASAIRDHAAHAGAQETSVTLLSLAAIAPIGGHCPIPLPKRSAIVWRLRTRLLLARRHPTHGRACHSGLEDQQCEHVGLPTQQEPFLAERQRLANDGTDTLTSRGLACSARLAPSHA